MQWTTRGVNGYQICETFLVYVHCQADFTITLVAAFLTSAESLYLFF